MKYINPSHDITFDRYIRSISNIFHEILLINCYYWIVSKRLFKNNIICTIIVISVNHTSCTVYEIITYSLNSNDNTNRYDDTFS